MIDINKEIWKDINEYKGIYQVSNFGRVKRIGNYKNQTHEWESNKVLKANQDKDGYLTVILCYKCNRKSYKIHRLVAMAFISNPFNLPQVNHKDEFKSNNNVTNLEWCTPKYNANYGNRNASQFIKVIQFDLEGNLIREWDSLTDVEKTLNIDKSHISKCCRNKIKSAYGFTWRYSNNCA